MKTIVYIFFSLIFYSAYSQEALTYHSDFEHDIFNESSFDELNLLHWVLAADPAVTYERAQSYETTVNEYIEKVATKRGSSDRQFISKIFYQVHRKFLKNYKQYSSLGTLLETGNYDCLSGTTFYAILFHKLGIQTQIVETTYHIYLKVITPEGEFLLESTDPLNGFISSKQEITQRLTEFAANIPVTKDGYHFANEINKAIGIKELIGLQYYNLAVDLYNNQYYLQAVNELLKTAAFYSNARISEFGLLLAETLMAEQDITPEVRMAHIHQLQSLMFRNVIVAAR